MNSFNLDFLYYFEFVVENPSSFTAPKAMIQKKHIIV